MSPRWMVADAQAHVFTAASSGMAHSLCGQIRVTVAEGLSWRDSQTSGERCPDCELLIHLERQ